MKKNMKRNTKSKQQTVNPTKKKTPFRFPLISDEEKNETVYGYPKEEKIGEIYKEEAPFEEPVYKPSIYTRSLATTSTATYYRSPSREENSGGKSSS